MLYKILKFPFFGSYMVRWKNPLSENEMKDWKRVTVKSKSGGTIEGLFLETMAENPHATIVLGHPMGKEAKGYFIKRGYHDFLKDYNYNVLIFDFNGFGESSHGSFSYHEDIIAIGKMAQKLAPELPIGYHGISLGAMWATIAFTDKGHPYKFAIIESAATTLEEFWKRFPVAYRMLKVLNFILPKYRKHINMVERIKETKIVTTLLFIYSRDDEWVDFEMSKKYLNNCPVKSELWSVDNAKHAEIVKSKSREDYFKKMVVFYDESLRNMVKKNKVDSAFLNQFTSVLLTSFDANTIMEKGLPTVSYLADRMNVSPKYLNELLKVQTGQTALVHIHNELLKQSKNLILNSDKTISTIAFELGFEYSEYFSSFFKEKTGISPTQFRSNLKTLILHEDEQKN